VSKRRTRRKLHLGVDEATGEILAGGVMRNTVHDSEVLVDLLEATNTDLEQVSADGAYDTRPCYEVIQEREAKAGIPPRKNAKIWQHGNCKALPHPRDENLRAIRQHGRQTWKQQSNYHRRSLAETTMCRLKTIFGGRIRSCSFDNQASELLL
jgi:IS5 family transposase